MYENSRIPGRATEVREQLIQLSCSRGVEFPTAFEVNANNSNFEYAIVSFDIF